jgi:hypothetical protein
VSFFAPVKHTSVFFNSQLYCDTMRDRWIIAYLELVSTDSGIMMYLDLAVSQSNSPTQPPSGAQYNIYQFTTNIQLSGATNSFCGSATLGDYCGVYITCANYRSFDSRHFVGNTVLEIYRAPLLTAAANPVTYSWNKALKSANDAGAESGAESGAGGRSAGRRVHRRHRCELWCRR